MDLLNNNQRKLVCQLCEYYIESGHCISFLEGEPDTPILRVHKCDKEEKIVKLIMDNEMTMDDLGRQEMISKEEYDQIYKIITAAEEWDND